MLDIVLPVRGWQLHRRGAEAAARLLVQLGAMLQLAALPPGP